MIACRQTPPPHLHHPSACPLPIQPPLPHRPHNQPYLEVDGNDVFVKARVMVFPLYKNRLAQFQRPADAESTVTTDYSSLRKN